MSINYQELDYRPTPIGTISLRRRKMLSLGVEVYEIKLGDNFLMSSLFTASEIALARLGLACLPGADLDVVVGGLGLGYTAQAVLEHRTVKSLIVIEMLEAVIDWHQEGLLPLGPELTADSRCRFIQGDFLRSQPLQAASILVIPTAAFMQFSWTSTILRRRYSTPAAGASISAKA